MLKVKLRSSRREKNKATPIQNETTTVKLEKKSSKQKMKEYRDRLKENPDTYKAYLASEAERNRAYRAKLGDQQRERQREKTRIRVQKFREKNKSALILKTPQEDALVQQKTPKTRQKVKDQREYWRDKKKEQRKNMTAQKRRRVNEKRRLNYAEKRVKKLTTKEKEKEERTISPGYKTKEAERKAVYRAKQSLPSSPNKFASVLAGIAASATPRKRAALQNDGIILTPSKRRRLEMCSQSLAKITGEIQSKKYKRSKLALSRRRILASSIVWSSNTHMRKNYGMSWAFAYKCSKLKGVWTDKKRSDALDEDTIKKVEDFFRQPCNSRCLPDKKHVSKKTMEPKRIMEVSIVDTYEKFREQNAECNISFSKFSSLRPCNVKTMNKNAFNNCLCEYCTNIELKVKAIEKVVGNRSIVRNRYDISKETLCSKALNSQFYHKKCLERRCDKCGPEKFTKSLTDVLNKKSTTLEWHRWENQTIIDRGVKKTRKMLQMKKNNVTLFMAELAAEIGPFSAHLHNAAWQYEQFSTLIKNVPEKWVVFCMDFAENYTCLYQDEAQSAHWNHGQVTLFSIVAYYHCQSCSANMNESLIFITPDRKHDSHAVHCFNTIANEYLKRKNIVIDRQIHFSDGAASQFKSKTPFEDLRKGSDDFGFHIEKHFFGSRHGKGPCDGEFGVVKRTVANAVKSRNTIHVVRTAEEFYMYAKGALTKPKDTDEKCCHTQRAFFLVEEKDIQRQRPDRINVKAIKDTRKKHGVKSLADGTLATRLLSCFCRECTTHNGTCINLQHVDDWESTSKKNKSVPLNKRDFGSKNTDKTQKRNMIKKDETQGIKSKKKNDSLRKKTKVPLNKKYVKRTKDEAVNDRFDNEWPKERSAYFQMVLLYLQSSESFDDLQAKCIEINESPMFHSYPFTVDKDIAMVTHNLAADRQAIDCMPRDGLELFSSMLPVCVIGDGNCLPRSASVACFGNETAHKEIRARIVVEMCLYKHQYVDNEYLNKGVDLPQKEAKNLVKTYAMFSEKYTPGDKLTNEVISRIYDAEVSEIVKLAYLWEFGSYLHCHHVQILECILYTQI
ncbi:uncharacterized protein LOC134726055 [Mytilus trossulus]|uniref:uncharacterized protein LOC134726055 n=1 Tax=Mytilus trossulus TaxID=6551 RepID=UPI00300778EE